MFDLAPGQWREDWDALYWVFVADHYDVFAANARSEMIASLLEQLDLVVLQRHCKRWSHLSI